VSLWDRIVETQEDAHILLPLVRNKYKLLDQGHHLRGQALNLTLYWNVMPIVGMMSTGRLVFPQPHLPNEYTRMHDGVGLGRGLGGSERVPRHAARQTDA